MTNWPTERAKGRHGIDWSQVGVLYLREMRAALRERAIVLNSILIPVFLYPFLLWVAFSGLTFVMGQTEGLASRVAVTDWPAGHPGLPLKLNHDEHIDLVETSQSLDDLKAKVRNGQLDAVLSFLPPDQTNAATVGGFKARIFYNQSQERSAMAQTRLDDAIEGYRIDWMRREAKRRGISKVEWQGFAVASHNMASGRAMGAFIMGMIAPIIFVVMVAVGCFYPAVDATAGERERHTWETLMSTAASRGSIVLAKYLYVASLGSLAGLLNLLAVIVTLKPIFAPLLERTGHGLDYTLPLTALPVVALAGLLLAGFVAAGMMIFAVFARTFKEGQSMIMPFYMLILVPIVFLQTPGLQFNIGFAFVPVVNLTLMVRQALSGGLQWWTATAAVVVSLAMIGLCLKLASFILSFEEVVTGSYQGTFFSFIRRRVLASASGRNGP